MEKAPSAGKTAALGVSGAGSGVVLLLYFAHKTAMFADMDASVAASIMFYAGGFVAFLMHLTQRRGEAKADVAAKSQA